MTPQLQATLAKLPRKPGVYLMRDERGRVLYVGKAQSLRNRVRQYWQASRSAAPVRIESAIDQVEASIEKLDRGDSWSLFAIGDGVRGMRFIRAAINSSNNESRWTPLL